MAKSGTTALYYKIKNSIKNEGVFHFEPDPSIVTGNETLVKNILYNCNFKGDFFLRYPPKEITDKFDKKILIIRDPRDTFVSSILYYTGYHLFRSLHPLVKKRFINKLRQKEINSDSMSIKELINELPQDFLPIRHYFTLFNIIDNGNHFLFKYEDMVDGNLDDLNDYLGIRIDSGANVDQTLNRVVRTKSYGNWRRWFTLEDIDYYQADINMILEKLGYDIDWTLSEDRSIAKEVASEYVIKISREE